MVAISILGIALGGLYSAASGATRNVRADERYAFAVELGRSLLADNIQVPKSGLSNNGVTAGGFQMVGYYSPGALWVVQGSMRGLCRRLRLLSVGQTDCAIVESSWIQLLKGCPAMSAVMSKSAGFTLVEVIVALGDFFPDYAGHSQWHTAP